MAVKINEAIGYNLFCYYISIYVLLVLVIACQIFSSAYFSIVRSGSPKVSNWILTSCQLYTITSRWPNSVISKSQMHISQLFSDVNFLSSEIYKINPYKTYIYMQKGSHNFKQCDHSSLWCTQQISFWLTTRAPHTTWIYYIDPLSWVRAVKMSSLAAHLLKPNAFLKKGVDASSLTFLLRPL